MPARVRIYDVEPKPDRPGLPSWCEAVAMDVVPDVGTTLLVEDHYWRIIRMTCHVEPTRSDSAFILGVRFEE